MSTSTILTVGAGQQYKTIAAAIAAANSLSSVVVIQITAGTYVNDGGTITNNNVTIEGVGGVAKLVGASADTGGVAAIAASGVNIEITNLDISGVTGGAGILVKSGTVYIATVNVHDNQEGIVAAADPHGALSVLSSDIGHNGTNIDIGATTALNLSSSYVHDAQSGDEIRSFALQNYIFGDVIADNGSNAAYTIDLPKGGTVGITGSMLEKGPASSVSSFISYGSSGSTYPSTQFTMSESYVTNDLFPATDMLFDHPIANLSVQGTNLTWNLPHIGGGLSATPATFEALSTREPLETYAEVAIGTRPVITTITGNQDGGVTIAGSFPTFGTVILADTVRGTTTLLGSAVTNNGRFSLTSHAKIDLTTLNSYTISGTDYYGHVVSMPGALILTDTGADHLTSTPNVGNVFAVMSFKGSDIIDSFKTTSSAGVIHDVLNFSGRGVTSFAQVQAMMSGSASTVLTMAGGKTITFEGVSPTTLSATDFAYS
jgi:hypothetical protein